MKFKNLKIILAGLILSAYSLANVANAHLIAFGWKDLGNGTIEMYGQHWHGDQATAYSDNGGVRIGAWDNNVSAAAQNTPSWQLFQWNSVMNNAGGDTTQNDALVTSGVLDGYAIEPSHWSNNSGQNDWFITAPLVLGNGTWGLFTGTGCCVDTMTEAGLFNISGISSVPSGTGPGSVGVPEPLTFAILGFGILGLGFSRALKMHV